MASRPAVDYQGPLCGSWQPQVVSVCDHDSCWAIACGSLVLTGRGYSTEPIGHLGARRSIGLPRWVAPALAIFSAGIVIFMILTIVFSSPNLSL